MEQVLKMPSQQPQYRRRRAHRDFLTNLCLPADDIKDALKRAWNAGDPLEKIPKKRVEQLVREKYATNAWNFKF